MPPRRHRLALVLAGAGPAGCSRWPSERPSAPRQLDFGSVLTGAPRAPASLAALSRTPELASVARVLSEDLRQVQRADPRSGTSVARHAHRLFDERWLSAESARFELIGVMNRMDRRPFHASGCGETRLVYRLAYAATSPAGARSRLPMTAAFDLLAPAGDARSCRRLALAWSRAGALSGPDLARFLASPEGPLARAAVDRANLSRLVVNLQSVRWPSTVRPDLGGHAEYVLRAFRWDGAAGRYAPLALENTPDVARIARDPMQRERLRAWLSAPENLARVDRGTALLPDEFLATKALSATPHGLARRVNRPFRVLFEPRDFDGVDFGGLSRVRSPEGLIRRLDQMTCPGCHQSGSVAGFHLLGEEDPALAHDALHTTSPVGFPGRHVHRELRRAPGRGRLRRHRRARPVQPLPRPRDAVRRVPEPPRGARRPDVDRTCAAQELGAVCRPPDSRHVCVSTRRLRPPS